MVVATLVNEHFPKDLYHYQSQKYFRKVSIYEDSSLSTSEKFTFTRISMTRLNDSLVMENFFQ